MDPLEAARGLVAAAFPDALAAFLGGSVLTERRTPTSDLDIVVALPGPTDLPQVTPPRPAAVHRELVAAAREAIAGGGNGRLDRAAREVLDRAGGWLQEGYTVPGELPPG